MIYSYSSGDRRSRADLHIGEHADENVRQRQGPRRRSQVRGKRRSYDRRHSHRRQNRRWEEHSAGPRGREHHEHPASQSQAWRFLSGMYIYIYNVHIRVCAYRCRLPPLLHMPLTGTRFSCSLTRLERGGYYGRAITSARAMRFLLCGFYIKYVYYYTRRLLHLMCCRERERDAARVE